MTSNIFAKLRSVTVFRYIMANSKAVSRPSSSLSDFQNELSKSKHVVILTGAGISAESGIPTFRGEGGFWRTYQAQDLATLTAFRENPSLVWEFYHYRREKVLSCKPNAGHYAVSTFQEKLRLKGGEAVVITQNIDGFHALSGTKDVIELHGNLFKTRCTSCGDERVNMDSPICEALRGKGAPDTSEPLVIPVAQLPQCTKSGCSGLLRPAVVWFGESLDGNVISAAMKHLNKCDLCLVVGTSAVVYPAAGFASMVASRGVPVAEFNLEVTPATHDLKYHFEGKSGDTLPKTLNIL